MKKFAQIVLAPVLAAVAVMFSVSAKAQSDQINDGYQSGRLAINFNSDILKTPSDECKQAQMTVAVISSTLPLPKGAWRFVVVCDETTWQHLMQTNAAILIRNDRDPSKGEIYADTILERRITILRGSKLVHPDKEVTPEHIIAHELAHIFLNSGNEKEVEELAMQWLQQDNNPAVLLAEFNKNKK